MAEPTVTTNDKSTVNLVVLLVGLAALVGIGGCLVLRGMGKDISDLVPIVTLALGALAGLLANTRSVDLGGMQELATSQSAQRVADALSSPPNRGDFNVTDGDEQLAVVKAEAVVPGNSPDTEQLV